MALHAVLLVINGSEIYTHCDLMHAPHDLHHFPVRAAEVEEQWRLGMSMLEDPEPAQVVEV